MTSEGIAKVQEWDDCIIFKAHCDCMADEHIHTLDISYEEEYGEMTLTLHSEICYYDKYHTKWFEKYWERIKMCFTLLTGGYPKVEDSFVFRGPQSIKEYIEALQSGMEKIKIFEKTKYDEKPIK